ncbi:DUF5054 domain-containing protein [Limimaricola pyoseonensis]|uniref:Glycosyl hydrolases family 38 N-terminal domain-containing protein n=1 Tax=Limimaricola pyoseonensis TaxID=521013 RepID=A0A1G7FRE9_9RHOB|nr:DUF5054 domain-containing protein [Limimaricola pyoseonensis]SDE78507.1 protein of unknown function [Limimaricola pyoseonensis]
MTPETIHLVFKTHLDIGFTDHAEAVRRLYHDRFIPQALTTAEHFHRENPDAPAFVWTTGAWLIHDHLATGTPDQVARLEAAIRAGLIRWHALPFTTHTELMSPALIRAGLSYSAELDARFGLTTRAAKMTDVPGHTIGLVPELAAAGVRFLHLGVNEASPVPDLPEIFLWRAPDGAEVVVMYDASYGGTHLPEGMTDALSFAHTADNLGPQSVAQTVVVHRELQKRFPTARIRAATLEEYGALLWERRDSLPVVTCEIGDSWIHGAGSDPAKLARFRALQRLYDGFEAEGLDPGRLEFGRRLCMVAEHTWGVDIKTFLRDETAWDRADFETARATDPRFAFCEASWAEQRGYLDAAVAALGPQDRARAEAAQAPAPPAAAGGDWQVSHDPATGDILALTAPDGRVIAGASGGPLLAFRHQSFDAADIGRHLDSYLTTRPDWAILDHDKPGLATARSARSVECMPRGTDKEADESGVSILAVHEGRDHAETGAPARLRWHVAPGPTASRATISLRIEGKPANRMPEAGFVHVAPEGAGHWEALKSGTWTDPSRSAERGGGALAAIFAARTATAAGPLRITPLDAALAGPPVDLMRFTAKPPAWEGALRFTLYTNKWGTNFPMWWEGALLSRFEIELG